MNRHQRRTLQSLKRRGLLKGLMSTRTQQDLNQEYTALCSQLGQIAEIRNQLDKDEDALFTRLEALKSEAQEVKKAEEAKAQAETPQAVQEAPSVVQA